MCFTGWRNLIKSEPRLLALHGELNDSALRDERIAPEEVHSALRQSGFTSLANVEAVVLETDGTVSVIGSNDEKRTASALHGVRGFPPAS